jgi:hypothetical protein
MKKQSMWLRILVLALALCMMVSVFAACATDEEDESLADGSENNDSTGTEFAGETDENGFLVDDLGSDLNFDRTIKILGESTYQAQFYIPEEVEGDPIKNIIYARNETVQERLGVEFQWNLVKGDWGSRTGFQKEVETACTTDPYDLMACYNLVPYMLAANGFTANLYDEENYLDLTAPWWPQSLLSEILVNDTLYAVTDSNDLGLLKNMMAMFFNNDLLEQRKIESPYDLVEKNEWTIDKLAELIKDTYEDKNTSSTVDHEDVFGFVNATASKRDAWFFALGYKYSEVKDGEITSLIGDPKMQDYVDKMVNFYSTNDTLINDKSQHKIFVEERAYFYSAGILMTSALKTAESTMHYGVVPLPKLTAEQSRYYTHLSNTYDTWCASFNASDLDVVSAVLECIASEDYRQVGPVYFDTYVKLRYATDEKLAPMYDLVRDSVTFDLIYLYSCAYTTNPKDSIKSCITNPTQNSWSSVYATNKDAWDSSFAQIVATYAKAN